MILHIDMDAFFAAIEQRDNSKLAGRPVIISRDHKRSVVATASYEARKFGIHSAMPVFQAKQLCSHLEIIAGNMGKYQNESKKIMAILSGFSPLVEPVSIDEAYLDISGCQRLFGSFEQIGMAIKNKIFNHLSLTSSVGIAPVKFLSKIASDMDKPDGLTIIEKSQVQKVINTLPIEQVPGVGKKAVKQMQLLKIKTLGDIQKYPLPVLTQKFGSMGKRLSELSRGMDASTITTDTKRKSISSETTLSADVSDYDTIKRIVLDKSQIVGRQLRKKNLICSSVAIKLKFSDFSQITRQNKLSKPVCSSTDIFNEAIVLIQSVRLKKKIRLIGVGVSGLKDKDSPVQLSLLTLDNTHSEQWESVDRAVDGIAEKFGIQAVKKAALKPIKNKKRSSKMTDIKQVKVIVTGRVQGVFYRDHTCQAAIKTGVTGYVKNLANGSVEAVFQGEQEKIDQMIEWCHKGSPASNVTDVKVIPDPGLPDFSSFKISY